MSIFGESEREKKKTFYAAKKPKLKEKLILSIWLDI